MDTKNYYQVMGLKKDATPQEIKMAYRRLARKYHPDLNKAPDAEQNFKTLGEAYEVLHDPQKRQAYDALQAQATYQDSTVSHPPHSEQAWSEWAGDFPGDEDWLASLFGAKRKGSDWHGSIRITLREAFSGVVKELLLSGDKHAVQQSIRVKIPAGVKANQQIRLAGMGGSNGRVRGDLYLKIFIEPDPLFDVVGNDVYLTLPITPWEAALGATVAVPTLAGAVDLKIPPHSQGGQKLRLKHRGLPAKVPGDQYVLLNIVIPEATTPAATALYERMAQEMPFNPRVSMEQQS